MASEPSEDEGEREEGELGEEVTQKDQFSQSFHLNRDKK